jgi:hypothetical protein
MDPEPAIPLTDAPPAKSAQQSIVVDCPLADVFAFGCDLAKRCQWQRGTVTGQLIDPDIAELGARCTETRKGPGGATEEWALEVVAFERDDLLTIRAECACGCVLERHVFAIDPSSTKRTRYTLTLEATGTRWTTGDLQRQIVDHLIHFRDCVERPEAMGENARLLATRLRRKTDEANAPAPGQAKGGGSAIGTER